MARGLTLGNVACQVISRRLAPAERQSRQRSSSLSKSPHRLTAEGPLSFFANPTWVRTDLGSSIRRAPLRLPWSRTMMQRSLVLAAFTAFFALPSLAALKPGDVAPNFQAQASLGG